MTDLPISTTTFYGRKDQLERLSCILDPQLRRRKGIVLYGIGGVGKTQLALRYVDQNKGLYRAIVWINTFSPDQSLADAVRSIQQLWPSKDVPIPYQGDNKAAFIRARLQSTIHKEWLLVLDSADNIDQVNLLQLIPDCSHGSIIITSTRKQTSDILVQHQFQSMEIDGLDESSAKELLIGKTGYTNTKVESTAVSKILKELGYLPIALEQAGILLRKRVLTFDNFVTEYKKHYKKLMGQPANPMDVLHEKERSFGVILSLLYTHIETESHNAALLLRVMAILGPSKIPVRFLLEVAQVRPEGPDINQSIANVPLVSEDETLIRLYLHDLEDLCLVKVQTDAGQPFESVLLHRVICQWLTDNDKTYVNSQIVPTALAVCRVLCMEKQDLDRYVIHSQAPYSANPS